MKATGLQGIPIDSAGVFCQCSRDTLFFRLEEIGIREVRTSGSQPWLRYHQYRQPEGMFYLFFNEHPTERVDTWAEVKGLREAHSYTECREETGNMVCRRSDQDSSSEGRKNSYWYDAWDNRLYQTEQNDQGQIRLHLSPCETKILYLGHVEEEVLSADVRLLGRPLNDFREVSGGKWVELTGRWQVSFKEYSEDSFGPSEMWTSLKNITGQGQKPEFSGTVRYEISFDWDPAADGEAAVRFMKLWKQS